MGAHTISRRTAVLGSGVGIGLLGMQHPAEAALAPVNVRDYGARPDGTTNSTSGFRAAITEAARRVRRSLGLGVVEVLVPGGSRPYLVDALILPTNVHLVGTGTDPRITPRSRLTRWVSTNPGSRNVRIRNLTLDTRGRIEEAAISAMERSTGLRLLNVRLLNTTGMRPRAGVDTRWSVRDLTVLGSSISGAETGIRLSYDPVNTVIQQTTIQNWLERAVWVRSTHTHAVDGLRIDRCSILPPSQGGEVRQPIQINGHDDLPIRNVRIIDNSVTGNGHDHKDPVTPGTADLISLHRCTSFLVARNTVRHGGEAGITVAQQCTNGVIEDNVVEDNGSAGIALGSGSSTGVSKVTVRRNRTVNNGRPGTGDTTPSSARSGIYVCRAVDIQVHTNRSGNSTSTRTQHYGITILSSRSVTLDANDLTGNARAEVYRG